MFLEALKVMDLFQRATEETWTEVKCVYDLLKCQFCYKQMIMPGKREAITEPV